MCHRGSADWMKSAGWTLTKSQHKMDMIPCFGGFGKTMSPLIRAWAAGHWWECPENDVRITARFICGFILTEHNDTTWQDSTRHSTTLLENMESNQIDDMEPLTPVYNSAICWSNSKSQPLMATILHCFFDCDIKTRTSMWNSLFLFKTSTPTVRAQDGWICQTISQNLWFVFPYFLRWINLYYKKVLLLHVKQLTSTCQPVPQSQNHRSLFSGQKLFLPLKS